METGDEAAFEEAVRRAVRDALGAEVTHFEPMRAHLALRRFARVRLSGSAPPTLVARLDVPEDPAGRPPGIPPEPPLEPIRALLEAHGLPVARRYGGDPARHLDLLEDLGDRSLADAAGDATPSQRRALYSEACDLVPRLQRIDDPGDVEAFHRSLDAAYFRYKADLFAEFSLTQRGREASPAERGAVHDAFAYVARETARAPRRLAHRDLQSANLLCAPGRSPALTLIDLQGAFLAPPEYDLVCLLRDSYVKLDASEVAAQLERVRPRLPDAPDAETFATRFDLLTLTRKGKDHARFHYAALRRGDRRFLPFVPATLRYLRDAATRAAAREPALEALAALIHELPETPCAP